MSRFLSPIALTASSISSCVLIPVEMMSGRPVLIIALSSGQSVSEAEAAL